MLAYTTEINVKTREVKTTFGKEVRTFCYNGSNFTLLDALKVAAEDFHNQLLELLEKMVQFAESQP